MHQGSCSIQLFLLLPGFLGLIYLPHHIPRLPTKSCWQEIYFYVQSGNIVRNDDRVTDSTSVKVTDAGNQELTDALTLGDGPLSNGAAPELAAANGKALLEEITSSTVVDKKAKGRRPPKTGEADKQEPKTFEEPLGHAQFVFDFPKDMPIPAQPFRNPILLSQFFHISQSRYCPCNVSYPYTSATAMALRLLAAKMDECLKKAAEGRKLSISLSSMAYGEDLGKQLLAFSAKMETVWKNMQDLRGKKETKESKYSKFLAIIDDKLSWFSKAEASNHSHQHQPFEPPNLDSTLDQLALLF
eukprot:Skav224231  [mRNA]  locus=scaffold939:1221384:1222283:+ [translate_table: standard]